MTTNSTHLKAGDRVQWMYADGGPGQTAESLGTVKYTTHLGGVSVQWDCDPPDSPSWYRPGVNDMTRLVVVQPQPRPPSVVIGELLDGIEKHGIRSIVDRGYRAEVPSELLALYEGDEGAARRAVQRLAFARAS